MYNFRTYVIEVYPNGTGEEELMAKSGRSGRIVRYRQGDKEPLGHVNVSFYL